MFLLVGPSGVGKTETAMALADLLYGGDRNMVIINMCEYKESHKVSRLDRHRRRATSATAKAACSPTPSRTGRTRVVLLDEVEKADESVQEIFYQVFDKGVLQNDDGEDVNFKNTIILLTSNVGTDTIMKACADPDTTPDVEGLGEMLRPDLLKSFKPALLGRMTVVPYYPLSDDGAEEDHRAEAEADRRPPAAELQGDVHVRRRRSWTRSPRGARKWTAGPATSTTSSPARCCRRSRNEVLARIAEGHPVKSVKVGVDDKSQLTLCGGVTRD